jgi:RNA-binding protein Luc7-like 2
MFKQEHENHIYGFVDDCDRRIKMAQRKLEKTPEENRKTVDLVSRVEESSFDVEDGETRGVSFWPTTFKCQAWGWKLDK